MKRYPIHHAAATGNAAALESALRAAGAGAAAEMEQFDQLGYTALMHAVMSPRSSAQMVRRLIEAGASLHRATEAEHLFPTSIVEMALRSGDLTKVRALVAAGADLRYSRRGYTALLDAIHGRDVHADDRLIGLLSYLVDQRVDLDSITEYAESALRVLSRLGRFDAVRLLLDAGADESQLAWTPLHRAVALESAREVRSLASSGADLESRDWWERTPFLVAVAAGRLDMAKLLAGLGADIRAVGGRNGQPALFYAIGARDVELLRWLLTQGATANATDRTGETVLGAACENDFPEAVDVLIDAGADMNATTGIYTALGDTRSPAIARRLLIAGADPAHITFEARRALVGFPPDPNINYLDATAAEFKRGARRRWGASNPQKMDEPFWRAMIVAGVNAWTAGEAFPEARADVESPIWCAQRFGQSITFLEDGRVIQVGGEHEDGYDPDFCIYNDVFVHEAGDVTIYGYPEQVFPPTDFHTATLMGNEIILIGGLRYPGSRKLGTTTVYSLNTQTLAIRPVRATGESPGWIYRHRAELKPDGGILVRGGTIAIDAGGTEEHVDNASTYRLDTDTWVWERVNGAGVNE